VVFKAAAAAAAGAGAGAVAAPLCIRHLNCYVHILRVFSVTLKTFQSNATLSVMFASRMCYAHYENILGAFGESTRVYYPRTASRY